MTVFLSWRYPGSAMKKDNTTAYIGNSSTGARLAALQRLESFEGIRRRQQAGCAPFLFPNITRKKETRQGSDKSPLAGQKDNQYGFHCTTR